MSGPREFLHDDEPRGSVVRWRYAAAPASRIKGTLTRRRKASLTALTVVDDLVGTKRFVFDAVEHVINSPFSSLHLPFTFDLWKFIHVDTCNGKKRMRV